jgi:hypothetical protein
MAQPAASPPGCVVTGVSANHVDESMAFIMTAQQHTPDAWPIRVFALAENVSSRFAGLCRVEYRRPRGLPPGSFSGVNPFDKRYLTNSAWKPLVIMESLSLLPEGGILLYGDASSRLMKPVLSHAPLMAALAVTGVVGRVTSSPVAHYTHPQTFVALGGGRAIGQYTAVPMMCGCVSLWQPGPTLMQRVLKPWTDCARREDCIKPKAASGFKLNGHYTHPCQPGLSGHCHRGDQSVLSILLHDHFVGAAGSPNGSHASKWPPYLYTHLSEVVRTERNAQRNVSLRRCPASPHVQHARSLLTTPLAV